jgi:hypothetical protein
VDVPAEQVLIGLTTSGLCAVGIAQQQWFLRETRKGQWLVEVCGTRNAVWVLRGLFSLGVVFGLALASGIVNPIRWTATPPAPNRVAEAARRVLPGAHEASSHRRENFC